MKQSDVSMLKSQIERLNDGLFLLVVVGEYNSGKSSCINALLGRGVVAEGVVPTTAEVTVVRYAFDEDALGPLEESQQPGAASPVSSEALSSGAGIVVLQEKVDLLKTITLVDSPGTNAIDRRHEALTKEFLPMCDLVLFVTSADRPFSESERVFLKSIRAWGKKCVLVLNKIDLLPDLEAQREVVQFVQSSSRALLGGAHATPKVFPVSSRRALEAKTSSTGTSGPHWDGSGFEALERYISQNLDAGARLRIKLDSVASVASAVGESYIDRVKTEAAVIEADREALSRVRDLVKSCNASIEASFAAHYARVDNALLELIERADEFLDTQVSLANIQMLVRKDAVAEAFNEQVVGATEREVERRARSLAEWVSEKLARNVADVASNFSQRVGERKGELRATAHIPLGDSMGFVTSSVAPASVTRDGPSNNIVSEVGDAAAELAASYDPAAEGKHVAQALSSSVRTAVALELSALGLLGTCLSVSALDMAGIASTGVLATGGLLVIPRRRSALRTELRKRIGGIRVRLEKELRARVIRQVEMHSERLQKAVEPFSTHTDERAEATALQKAALRASLDELRRLK